MDAPATQPLVVSLTWCRQPDDLRPGTQRRACSRDGSSRQFVEVPPAAHAPATQHAHNQRLDPVPLSLSGQRPPFNPVRVNALRGRTHPQGPCHSKRWHLSTYAIAYVPFGTKASAQPGESQHLARQTVPRGVQSGSGYKRRSPDVFRRPGSQRTAATYSPNWWVSTIGAGELNFSVRNGKRWILTAVTTALCYLREKTSEGCSHQDLQTEVLAHFAIPRLTSFPSGKSLGPLVQVS